ncbi:MAG: hypothetical protein K2F63_05650, partial [Muribaculaceae bacterium]|nr:hypothetical protein [Muribaculaceae bacterium]
QYNFTHMLFASISASQNRFLPRPGISPDQYKYGIFACANIFWNITPRVTLAAEYDWGTRHNISGAHRQANRANLMVAFTF